MLKENAEMLEMITWIELIFTVERDQSKEQKVVLCYMLVPKPATKVVEYKVNFSKLILIYLKQVRSINMAFIKVFHAGALAIYSYCAFNYLAIALTIIRD